MSIVRRETVIKFNLYQLDKANASITFIDGIWGRGISLLDNFE